MEKIKPGNNQRNLIIIFALVLNLAFIHHAYKIKDDKNYSRYSKFFFTSDIIQLKGVCDSDLTCIGEIYTAK